jgi:hypothetical protein
MIWAVPGPRGGPPRSPAAQADGVKLGPSGLVWPSARQTSRKSAGFREDTGDERLDLPPGLERGRAFSKAVQVEANAEIPAAKASSGGPAFALLAP